MQTGQARPSLAARSQFDAAPRLFRPSCSVAPGRRHRSAPRLPLHLVGLVTLAQAERGGEVAREEVHLLNVCQQSLVDRLLVRGAVAADLLLLFLAVSAFPPTKPDTSGEPARTWGFSPCLKKDSSPAFSLAFSPVKYFGCEISPSFLSSTPLRSTFCDVAMTYRALTLRSGTPLILKGPVTRRTPWSRFLRRTTRLPRKRPASRIRIVPGCSVFRGAQGRVALRT